MSLSTILLLVFAILITVLFVILSIYFIVFFAHKNEKMVPGYKLLQAIAIAGFAFPMMIISIPAFDFLNTKIHIVQEETVDPFSSLKSLENIYTVSNLVPYFLLTGILFYFGNIFFTDYYRNQKTVVRTRVLQSCKRPLLIFLFYVLLVLLFYFLG